MCMACRRRFTGCSWPLRRPRAGLRRAARCNPLPPGPDWRGGLFHRYTWASSGPGGLRQWRFRRTRSRAAAGARPPGCRFAGCGHWLAPPPRPGCGPPCPVPGRIPDRRVGGWAGELAVRGVVFYEIVFFQYEADGMGGGDKGGLILSGGDSGLCLRGWLVAELHRPFPGGFVQEIGIVGRALHDAGRRGLAAGNAYIGLNDDKALEPCVPGPGRVWRDVVGVGVGNAGFQLV